MESVEFHPLTFGVATLYIGTKQEPAPLRPADATQSKSQDSNRDESDATQVSQDFATDAEAKRESSQGSSKPVANSHP